MFDDDEAAVVCIGVAVVIVAAATVGPGRPSEALTTASVTARSGPSGCGVDSLRWDGGGAAAEDSVAVLCTVSGDIGLALPI